MKVGWTDEMLDFGRVLPTAGQMAVLKVVMTVVKWALSQVFPMATLMAALKVDKTAARLVRYWDEH